MTPFEIGFLVVVVAAFLAFMVSLFWVSMMTGKREQSVAAPVAKPAPTKAKERIAA